jgi:hypothetical protein
MQVVSMMITILDEALSGTKFEPGKTGGTQADYYNSLLKNSYS